ncbi:MAG: hypothetical protein J6T33_11035 [Bacteroidales bacterium]|nr:hypothetical protein [Bacteroidales bacterium]MBP5759191.1 hypothetical protein [Bacteroidales bacterium]
MSPLIMPMNKNIILTSIAALLLCLSCNKFEGDQTVPAFISIDKIEVANDPHNSISNYSGCFTSNIDAVQITLRNSEENHQLGVFTLPCRVPVLRQGEYTISLTPVIKLNGIAATRSSYPFYRNINIKNQTLTPDRCLELGSQTTYYDSTGFLYKVWEEYFEPEIPTLSLPDTIVQRVTSPDTVRSDRGCGAVYLKTDQSAATFISNEEFTVTDNGALFLELDYWTNVPLSVGLCSRTSLNSKYETFYAITLYPNFDKGWNKIYIQLGKLWSQYSYYKQFHIAFQSVNSNGIEGKVYIDNIKLTAYKGRDKK